MVRMLAKDEWVWTVMVSKRGTQLAITKPFVTTMLVLLYITWLV